MNYSDKLILGLWGVVALCFLSPLAVHAQGSKESTVTVQETPSSDKESAAADKESAVADKETPAADKESAVKEDTSSSPGSGEELKQESVKEVKKSLYLETLAQDINTADYYELVDWCQNLNLSDAGEVSVLKNRLYTFFEISPPKEAGTSPVNTTTDTTTSSATNKDSTIKDAADKLANTKNQPKNANKSIQIRSAKSTEYFQIEEINEDYLILQGDVIIEFEDKAEGSVHTINADRVMVNQTQKLLTAVGNIKYTLKNEKEEPEIFTGESFAFNIESWVGGFVDARGEKVSEVDVNKSIKFFYSGEALSRLQGDIIILKNGNITSCEETEDPHWSIKARKIWVLAPGEWAIRDAVFHVGRVPVFYLPFFFKPGDDFFFHPAIGYRNREGAFIQTTTYILGQKKEKGSAFSFLRASDDEKEVYEMELNGLFLRKGEKKEVADTNQKLFKLILDFYSRLGGFIGTVIDLNFWKLRGGLGFSRTLYLENNHYTPYKNDMESSDWNTTPLWDSELPFRFGFDTSFNTKFNLESIKSTIDLAGSFQLYSDPFFANDFYNRQEEIDWLQMIRGEESEGQTSTSQGTETAIYDLVPNELKNNYKWNLSSNFNFPSSPPYISSLRLSNISFDMDWIGSNDLTADANDPARQFYIPTRMNLPNNANLTITGTLINWSSEKKETAKTPQAKTLDVKPGDNLGKGFNFPDSGQGPGVSPNGQLQADAQKKGLAVSTTESLTTPAGKQAGKQDTQAGFSIPGMLDDLTVELARSLISTFNLSYTLTPYLTIQNLFDTDNWTVPENVDFRTKSTDLIHSGTFNLNYKYNLWNSLINGNGHLILTEKYVNHLYTETEAWGWNTDIDRSSLVLNGMTNISLRPLTFVKYFSGSQLNYNFDWDFYKYYGLNNEMFIHKSLQWNKEYVKNHKVTARLDFKPENFSQFISLSANLPPLLGEYLGDLEYTFDFAPNYLLKNRISTGYFEKNPGNWEFKPFINVETLILGPYLYFEEELEWNLNSRSFVRARSWLKLLYLPFWSKHLLEQELVFRPDEAEILNLSRTILNVQNFRALLEAENMEIKVLDVNEGWKTLAGDRAFMPKLLKLEYNYDANNQLFWKNRIETDFRVNTFWDIYFQEFTRSYFEFKLGFDFKLHQFLQINFNVASRNTHTYLYFPAFANKLDMIWVNPAIDLLKSFNLFYTPHRKESNFKLNYIDIGFTHHLHDWDLNFKYIGRQQLTINSEGKQSFIWQPEYTIAIEWNPIPELIHKMERNKDGLNIRG